MLNTIEYIDITNQIQEAKISINPTTVTQSEPIKETGIYMVWWDVACYIKVSSVVGDTVTADTGLERPIAGSIPIRLHKGSMITAKSVYAASGTIRLIRVGGG